MRSLRARRQQVQNFLAFVLAFGLDAMSENELGTGLVHARLAAESEAFERLLDRPSGKNFGDFGDIALRVSAIHADCMQFQQLAAVIFIEAGVLLAPLIRFRGKTAGPPFGPYPMGLAGIPCARLEFGPTLIQ